MSREAEIFKPTTTTKLMKTSIPPVLVAVAALYFAGCASSHDKGPYLPQNSMTPPYESTEPVVLMDPGMQYSVTTVGQTVARLMDDGRMEVVVQLRNRENRRIEVQGQCVFKDEGGITTGDETPWLTLILTENSTEQMKFTSSNNKAKRFTIRVRQAR
jgi:uncharacterized protein YcfL